MSDPTITRRNRRYRQKLADQRGLRRVEVVIPAGMAADLKAYARHLRDLDLRRRRPNAEAVNDRAKLLHHRLVARHLRLHPESLNAARRVVEGWIGGASSHDDAHLWRILLERPLDEIRGAIVSRSPEAYRLRLGSPFRFVPELRIVDEPLRRRLWRLARRPFEAARTSTVPSDRSPTISRPTRSS